MISAKDDRDIGHPQKQVRFVTNINRRKCSRTVPMRVLVLGLSRTGTESLRKALVHLGYDDTYHGYAASAENPRDCEMWLQAMRAKFDGVGEKFTKVEWDQLLGHCQAVCDVPAACFAEELIAAYPDAKIILTNRDVDAWHNSVSTTLVAVTFTRFSKFVAQLAILTRSPNRWTRPAFVYALSNFFYGDFEKNGKGVYQEHYNLVRTLAAARRMPLLEYTIEQGWGPLCSFLGHETPAVPFPQGNTKAEVNERMRAVLNSEVKRLMSLFMTFLTILVLILLMVWVIIVVIMR